MAEHFADSVAEVRRVAEREHATVAAQHDVAVARGRRKHADKRRARVPRAGTAERSLAERKDTAVAGDHPIAVALRPRSHGDDRLVEADPTGRSEEPGVT